MPQPDAMHFVPTGTSYPCCGRHAGRTAFVIFTGALSFSNDISFSISTCSNCSNYRKQQRQIIFRNAKKI